MTPYDEALALSAALAVAVSASPEDRAAAMPQARQMVAEIASAPLGAVTHPAPDFSERGA